MKVEKFLPAIALQPFVREFIIIESDLATDSSTIPDTSMVMSFRYKGRVQMMEGDEKSNLPATVVSGLRKSSRHFTYEENTSNLLVVFTEGGINAFSRTPAHELFEQHVHSGNLFHSSTLNEILERLAEAANKTDRIKIMQSFLLRHLTNTKADLLIDNALQLIKRQNGIIRVKDLAASLYISQDAFEKRFRTMVGSTPKQYASIVRLRHLINAYPSFHSLTDASYEAGYFDQSHFIKDFRLFTGQTPKDFFRSGQYW
ncbi:helix-turn-helix transcriptional regulator [Flavitalea sp. BT771]|uniref:helix-turn-helix transcriptional regulator n=1 Tax=Flavitalea sp. BT771 TaxID=3063329 RepID=UPI0026E2CD4C|nr:helix-turn-helix transcriptional regulator [Flavitalea sp. BT771]MDO6433679.1 helix-turn-helix transcriptional regulator [Flavitalea sp. BT771]MDV6222416.1 helix-turn-helix transcriptional regulator [Flavitalea sp. BT771]